MFLNSILRDGPVSQIICSSKILIIFKYCLSSSLIIAPFCCIADWVGCSHYSVCILCSPYLVEFECTILCISIVGYPGSTMTMNLGALYSFLECNWIRQKGYPEFPCQVFKKFFGSAKINCLHESALIWWAFLSCSSNCSTTNLSNRDKIATPPRTAAAPKANSV